MIYTISTDFCEDIEKRPCPEAKKIVIPLVDRRKFTSFEDFDSFKKEAPWRSIGTNHRVLSDNSIARDIGTVEKWAVEFNTMEDFEAFLARLHKNVVVLKDYDNPDYFHIEICEEIF